MTKQQLRKTQCTIANGCVQDYNRIQRWQMIPYGFVKWTKISNVKIGLRELFTLPYDYSGSGYTGKFYYTMFDFQSSRSPFSVVRHSERLTTSAFENSFSLN